MNVFKEIELYNYFFDMEDEYFLRSFRYVFNELGERIKGIYFE